jgi:hypothetical protein
MITVNAFFLSPQKKALPMFRHPIRTGTGLSRLNQGTAAG